MCIRLMDSKITGAIVSKMFCAVRRKPLKSTPIEYHAKKFGFKLFSVQESYNFCSFKDYIGITDE